ncbi:MAG: hypothetical protein C4576_15985 [Desulfobacteraceae bacterium]|nr:MAG: hypothetical protein C4576_15985 [Desulfobacteraceae bacterium]
MSDVWAGVDIKKRLKEALRKSKKDGEEIRQKWLAEWDEQKKSSSILFEFIADKTKHYEEPERKGLRKGEEIGPSRKQYIASLWVALTSLSLKHIADINKNDEGLSYQVLMQWSCRDSFKKLIEKHQADFEGAVIEYLASEYRNTYQSISDFLDGKTSDLPPVTPSLSKVMNRDSLFFNEKIVERLKDASYRLEEWAKYDAEKTEQERQIQLRVSESLKALVGYVTGKPYHQSGAYSTAMAKGEYAMGVLTTEGPLSERSKREVLLCLSAVMRQAEYQRSQRTEVEGLNAATD